MNTPAQPDTYTEVTELAEPTPAGLQITARVIRRNGTSELNIKFGPDSDMPDDDELIAMAARLGEKVWAMATAQDRERPRFDDRRRHDSRGRRGRGPMLPPAPSPA